VTHVACLGDGRGVYRVFVGSPEGIGGRITLRWTLGR
jgi:hypothetical protein